MGAEIKDSRELQEILGDNNQNQAYCPMLNKDIIITGEVIELPMFHYKLIIGFMEKYHEDSILNCNRIYFKHNEELFTHYGEKVISKIYS